MDSKNKILTALFKRLKELDQENKHLKEQLSNQSTVNNPSSSEPYLKIKELMLTNSSEQQLCSLCDCELDKSKTINLLKLYFCNHDCSLLMEKAIESVIDALRKQ